MARLLVTAGCPEVLGVTPLKKARRTRAAASSPGAGRPPLRPAWEVHQLELTLGSRSERVTVLWVLLASVFTLLPFAVVNSRPVNPASLAHPLAASPA